MNKFQQSCRALDTTFGHLLSGLLVFLVVDVSWQVLTRFLLSQPSSVTEELAHFLLIWIGLLGAVHAYRARMHLGIDLFTRKLSLPRQENLHRVVHLACALFAVSIFIIGGGNLSVYHLVIRSELTIPRFTNGGGLQCLTVEWPIDVYL